MSNILTALTSVLNISINKYINTGDRNFDNALVLLITILTSTSINYILNIDYLIFYNKILYYLFYFFRDVSDPKKVPYLHPDRRVFMNNGLDGYKNLDMDLENPNKFIKFIEYKKYNVIHISGSCMGYGEYISIYVYKGYVIYGILLTQSNKYSRLILYSYDSASLVKANNKILGDYKEYIDMIDSQDKSQKIFYMKSDGLIKELGNISKNKVFDTLFYDQKDHLINLLTRFKNGSLYPKCISMDNKLGILLYGPPGTGKTGTISAIANMLKRDVLQINFSEITTCVQLDSILSESNRNKILVFDEFDCIMDALINPTKISQELDNTSNKWSELLAVAEGDERKEILKMVKENKLPTKDTPLDLGYLLYKLDGLEDNNNRIIIATTNNPDKINPTLLRPGRFDIKLCLQNCSKQMYKDIIGNYFNNYNFDVDKLPDKKYSPLEVINKCLVHNNLDKVLTELK